MVKISGTDAEKSGEISAIKVKKFVIGFLLP